MDRCGPPSSPPVRTMPHPSLADCSRPWTEASGACSPRTGCTWTTGRPPRKLPTCPRPGSGLGAVGAIRRRFEAAEAVFTEADVPTGGDQIATEVAQPRIVAGSVAAMQVLRTLGVDADIADGHSLGELTALSWAGALSSTDVCEAERRRPSPRPTWAVARWPASPRHRAEPKS